MHADAQSELPKPFCAQPRHIGVEARVVGGPDAAITTAAGLAEDRVSVVEAPGCGELWSLPLALLLLLAALALGIEGLVGSEAGEGLAASGAADEGSGVAAAGEGVAAVSVGMVAGPSPAAGDGEAPTPQFA